MTDGHPTDPGAAAVPRASDRTEEVFDSFEHESEAYRTALATLSDGAERDFRIIEGTG